MELTFYTCAVATIVLVLRHVQGISDLKQLSLDVQHRFISEVLFSIARKQQLTKNVDLDDITVDADNVTTVFFSHLHLLNTDVDTSRIVGEYGIESNEVQPAFPRSGRINVAFRELLKEMGFEFAVSSVQLPAVKWQKNYSTYLNKLVDFILTIVQEGLQMTGHSQIKIPDLDVNFTSDIIFFPVSGRFRAADGWLKNLSTIYRTSDIKAELVDTTLTVVCSFGLQILEFGFSEYEANLGLIEASGTITGVIPHNSITAKVSSCHLLVTTYFSASV
jgi:hypothetical protein